MALTVRYQLQLVSRSRPLCSTPFLPPPRPLTRFHRVLLVLLLPSCYAILAVSFSALLYVSSLSHIALFLSGTLALTLTLQPVSLWLISETLNCRVLFYSFCLYLHFMLPIFQPCRALFGEYGERIRRRQNIVSRPRSRNSIWLQRIRQSIPRPSWYPSSTG